MTLLRKCGAATDWAVVIVEPADTKKTNKLLPRTSVLDKLKTDVGGKQPERCISLIGEAVIRYIRRCLQFRTQINSLIRDWSNDPPEKQGTFGV